MKKFILALILSALFGQTVNMNRAKAAGLEVTIFATVLSVIAVATVINSASGTSKELLLDTTAEDAAAFIANDGANASAFLTQILLMTRADLDKQGVTEPVSDLEIAQAILEQAAK